MKKLSLVVFLLSAFLSVSYAYEMHGTLNDNSDGTFEVNIVSNTGYQYMGFADLQGDGTLVINVAIQGAGSEVYLGTATPNASGNYDLHLKNNSTGKVATGILEKS